MSKKKESLRRKTAKAIATAATVSTVVATPAVFDDDEIINPQPVSEEIIIEQQQDKNETPSKIPYWIKSLTVTPLHFLLTFVSALLTSMIRNPLVRNILLSLLLVASIVLFMIIGARKLFPHLSVKSLIRNRHLILTTAIALITFIGMDVFASNSWDQYDSYGPKIKIALSIIILICGCYLLYADNREKYLVISDGEMTISH